MDIQRSEDNKSITKGFLSAIAEYGNIQQKRAEIAGQRAKLESDILMNDFQAKQNFFYKMMEKKQEQQMQEDFLKKMQSENENNDLGMAPYQGARPKSVNVNGAIIEFPNPEETLKNKVLQGTATPEERQRLSELNRINKGTMDGKTLVSPQIDKISRNEDAYSTLGTSLSGLEANKDRFSQFLGPGKGVLRNPIRSYVNKDLQDFLAWKANVQDAFQQYRVAVTGAQASDKEISLLAKNRPTEDDTYDVFVKKTREAQKIGNRVLHRYITNLGKAGYNVSGYEDTVNALNEEMMNLTGENKSISQVDNPTQNNQAGGKQIDKDTALQFLQQANGDRNKARELAKQSGYIF